MSDYNYETIKASVIRWYEKVLYELTGKDLKLPTPVGVLNLEKSILYPIKKGTNLHLMV